MTSFIASIDYSVLQALYSARSPIPLHALIWVSELATVQIILGFTFIAAIIFAYRKRWDIAGGLLASVGGSGVVTWVIKEIIARPRPAAEAVYFESTSSFPSSHANLVITFYGFLLLMSWKYISPVQRKIAAVIFGITALSVGFSRLYLGVHYLSDVIAGYILGCIFVYLGILVARKIEQKQSGLPKSS